MSATVTLMFTDVVGSTQLLDDLGDEQFNELRRVHFRLLRDAIVEYRGQEVKNLGDGLMAVFPSVVDACRCAIQMQGDVADGRLEVVGIYGEPGMGKTRLVAEAAKAASAGGAIVVHGRCDEEGMVAFMPLLDVLRQLARAMPADLLADLASPSAELAGAVP